MMGQPTWVACTKVCKPEYACIISRPCMSTARHTAWTWSWWKQQSPTPTLWPFSTLWRSWRFSVQAPQSDMLPSWNARSQCILDSVLWSSRSCRTESTEGPSKSSESCHEVPQHLQQKWSTWPGLRRWKDVQRCAQLVLCLEVATPVFQTTAVASDALQQESVEHSTTYKVINGVLDTLKTMRSEEFQKIFEEAESLNVLLPTVVRRGSGKCQCTFNTAQQLLKSVISSRLWRHSTGPICSTHFLTWWFRSCTGVSIGANWQNPWKRKSLRSTMVRSSVFSMTWHQEGCSCDHPGVHLSENTLQRLKILLAEDLQTNVYGEPFGDTMHDRGSTCLCVALPRPVVDLAV